MKVLLSAYACEPGKGSEPEVGLRTLLAVSRAHDVWVITRDNNLPSLNDYLEDAPFRDRIHLIGLDLPEPLLRLKKRYHALSQLYYDHWQRALTDRALELDRRVQFDVVHHVTFAAYWKRTGVAAIRRPLVWGPVGGGVSAPLALYGGLGARGIAEELARTLIRPPTARLPRVRSPQRRAAVVLVQNAETAARLRTRFNPIILPNALAASVSNSAVPATRQRTVVSVARLVPWKGVHLAVRAFAAVKADDLNMVVIGRGRDLPRVERLAAALGVSERVSFLGQLSREEVLQTVAAGRALIHTALHEEAGFAVSEALSHGTPVVCLERGGPPELLRQWPNVPSCAVPPRSRGVTVRALADALTHILEMPPTKTGLYKPVRSYDKLLLDAYEQAVKRGPP